MRAVGLLLFLLSTVMPSALSAAEPKPKPDEMVNNPPYAHWSAFKPGTTVKQREIVTLPNGDKVEQVITSKLLKREKDKVVVETTMTEAGVDGKTSLAESTKTVSSFPAKVKMSQVDTPAEAGVTVTEGVEDVDVKGKKINSEWVEATTRSGDEVMTEKIWTARDVPGGIIKRTITRKKGDTVTSSSQLELVEFK
jgi:hypothetical protein